MSPLASAVRNEKGVALPLALFVLVMLSGLLLAFLSMAGMEPQISSNLSATARARYLADGGIEWAFDQLLTLPAAFANYKDYWDSKLRGPDNIAGNADDGQLASGMALPGGLTVTSGTFTVTIRNDNQAGDNAITGQALDPGGNTDDQNSVVIVTATGTYNGVTRQVQAVVRRLPDLPGGVSLPGLGTNTNFDGNTFTISGNDTNPDGSAGSCAPVWGIGVADTATETLVEASLSAQQQNNVVGKPQTTGPGQGANTIAVDNSLTPAEIAAFVNKVKQGANITLQTSSTSHIEKESIGNTCSSNWNDANCWGTTAKPKIVYLKAQPDPTPDVFDLQISGNSTGAGILIIEDGDLRLSGNFRWEGLVIITGQYAGVKYAGGGNQDLYGGIVVNQTQAVNPNTEVDARGNAKVFYSCQAIKNVQQNLRAFGLGSWREL